MGRVSTLLDVGAYLKLAATVAVALLAFGAMASPAWAQDTTLGMNCEPSQVNPNNLRCTVSNESPPLGGTEAEGVSFSTVFTSTNPVIDIIAVSSTQGTCQWAPAAPTFQVVGCSLGDLPATGKAVITMRILVKESGALNYKAVAAANNAPTVDTEGQIVVSTNPGEEPGGDNGERVLVEHKGKELCLPKAALNGHEKHGDGVIDEEGCSEASSAKNGKSGCEGGARSSKAL